MKTFYCVYIVTICLWTFITTRNAISIFTEQKKDSMYILFQRKGAFYIQTFHTDPMVGEYKFYSLKLTPKASDFCTRPIIKHYPIDRLILHKNDQEIYCRVTLQLLQIWRSSECSTRMDIKLCMLKNLTLSALTQCLKNQVGDLHNSCETYPESFY